MSNGLAMTVRGGGVPCRAMAVVPTSRMGPPPRSFAADAHVCIMVRVNGPTGYKVAARSSRAPTAGSPRTSSRSNQHAVVLGHVKAKPAVAAETRPALTRPVRAGFSILRSGRGKACGAVEPEKQPRKLESDTRSIILRLPSPSRLENGRMLAARVEPKNARLAGKRGNG
jgi:hypothetical protein